MSWRDFGFAQKPNETYWCLVRPFRTIDVCDVDLVENRLEIWQVAGDEMPDLWKGTHPFVELLMYTDDDEWELPEEYAGQEVKER